MTVSQLFVTNDQDVLTAEFLPNFPVEIPSLLQFKLKMLAKEAKKFNYSELLIQEAHNSDST